MRNVLSLCSLYFSGELWQLCIWLQASYRGKVASKRVYVGCALILEMGVDPTQIPRKLFWQSSSTMICFPGLPSEDRKCEEQSYLQHNCPKGILCGRRLKTRVRLSGFRVRPDFWTVSSINSSLWDNIFDRYNQGIRDHLKSVDCPLLSFIGYSAQHAACQKHTFLYGVVHHQ